MAVRLVPLPGRAPGGGCSTFRDTNQGMPHMRKSELVADGGSGRKLTRINIEADEPVVDLIKELKGLTGTSTKTVVIGALLGLKWMLDQELRGRKIAAIELGDDGEEEVAVQFEHGLIRHAVAANH